MPVADLMKLVDHGLLEVFNRKPVDPTKARKPFLKAIEKARKQFNDGKQPRGPAKFWEANNNVVVITPNVRGEAIEIGGQTHLPVPSERFLDALKIIEADVNAGELDSQLVKDSGGVTGGNGRSGEAVSSKRKRGPMSDEAKAARREKMAASGSSPEAKALTRRLNAGGRKAS